LSQRTREAKNDRKGGMLPEKSLIVVVKRGLAGLDGPGPHTLSEGRKQKGISIAEEERPGKKPVSVLV